jgi:flagellar L-ring protein precursor FlgH
VAAWAAPVSAQSLWDKRSPSKTFLFSDTQARRVGDLLTVVVSESTDVDNKEQRSLGKETEANSEFSLAHSAKGIFGSSTGALSGSGSMASDRQFDGNAEFSSERVFTDRVTVAVMDVLPNGNLVISGRRHIDVAGDKRCLVISGIARHEDVRPDNTIQSRYISNLEVTYEGQGVENSFTKQGWLGRAVNWLWPF